MRSVNDFSDWMKTNSKLSDSSIYKYSRAMNTISNEMLELGVIPKSIFEMNRVEIDLAMTGILCNSYFSAKNEKGNNMYSNSLKQYRYYVLATSEKEEQEERIAEELKTSKDLTETEKETIINARIGQGTFRKFLIDKYQSRCIVTGIDNPKLLIASHIKPWAICDNKSRVDVENGFLLCPNYDRLFDCGLITFTSMGRMQVSSFVGKENEKRLGLANNTVVDLRASKTLLNNLEYHRDVLFVK
ncbi:MAG: HNH endonuclease [Eubacteriales bacterium]|nr:HNH endonuclease [Eubacteriales bacterium]MDD3350326.1 HNH endonuclease [Eubacteriales bacterium]